MSKITFRADDDLVERLDGLDASKSEVMREALREFLDRRSPAESDREVTAGTADLRLGERGADLTVNINLDGVDDGRRRGDESSTVDADAAPTTDDEPVPTAVEPAAAEDDTSCKQCGEALESGYAFCPNCGEEHRRRPRCECGQEIRADWAFCPRCGRRGSASDVFDRA